ncbi:tRNA (adenosine(37)-N6)-dimethylallyltransferase MiaA [Buchnera aphidicola (Chaitoregma tattakana)]|uniref:tRNA (adenosine(37)-N6)-dimethylallyltransferase MiaA n=1 Tax=Buchnera aphidicola TaxID=9 RepID=UPI0031B886E4
MIENNKVVIFLMGPTCCGKTSLAMDIHNSINSQIISVDSSLVYKKMNIGTAKPTINELKKYPHKLVDIKYPNECYSVADFYSDALREIKQAFLSNKVPLLVGGTMLYYKILLEGLINLPKKNVNLSKRITLCAKNNRILLHKKLSKIDPCSASKININDIYRLSRALEVYYTSGKKKSSFFKKKRFKYTVLQFVIVPIEKKFLYNRIFYRLQKMINLGFEKEVYELFKNNVLHVKSQAMNCIGYSQMWNFINEKITYDQMFNEIFFLTKKLVKKQMTWIRSWKNLNFLYFENNKKSKDKIFKILKNFKKNS